ncbi:arsenate reductase ArsC [candidate division KSB1 bacterium]|nr:arsenate reductase ArsC [candidate division KSB1 bacterium]
MTKQRLLFLCTGNSCRSQIAEALLTNLAGDRFEAFSAGTQPTQLNPRAIQTMNELGIDISNHKSQSVEIFLDQKFDYVITVCDAARETCPVFPNSKESLHWSLEDPAEATGSEEEIMKVFRRVRDQIRKRLQEFMTD